MVLLSEDCFITKERCGCGGVMEEFCVLHLSDLHIDNCTSEYSTIYCELIKDIKKIKEEKKLQKFMLVVSGDIFNKGNIEKQFLIAIKFLKDVCETLEIVDKKHVIIVPGNHDIIRDKYIESIIDSIENKVIKVEEKDFIDKKWRFFCSEFEEYNKFYSELLKTKAKINTDSSFGVSVVEIGNSNICIIRLNSSWFCRGDNDYQKLRIGEWQLDYLAKKLKDEKKKGTKIDLTVAVMHHPLSWLSDIEKNLVKNYFTDENLLDVNIVMCGHVHRSKVFNWFDLDNSILTLVSGIGWDASDKSKDKKECRYAVYKFDISNLLVDVWMRKTNDKGKFISDNGVYNNIDSEGHFSSAIKNTMFNRESYLPITQVKGDGVYRLYTNKAIINEIKEVTLQLSDIKTHMYRYLIDSINYLFESIKKYDYYATNIDERNKLEKLKPAELITELISLKKSEFIKTYYDNFISYIHQLCMLIHKWIFKVKLEPGKKSVRIHARIFDPKDKLFKKLVAICGNVEYDEDMKEINWKKSMIYHAYKKGGSLVKSINLECHQTGNNDATWIDYITIPIKMSVYDKGLKESVPLISFGISISDNKFRNTLYILNYLAIDVWIQDFLTEYEQMYYGSEICDIIKLYQNYKTRGAE